MVREAFLVDYPYPKQGGKYLLHKEKQQTRIWGEYCTSTMCCRGQTKNELIYMIMFWLGITLAIIAIIVTLIKELFEGVKSEDTILHLSIGELVLAVFSVVTTLSKHLIKHNEVIETQKLVQSNEQNGDKVKMVTQRRKVQIILSVVLILFVGVILIGFVVMHTKDDDEHAYLTYTKFTTVITLFLSIILDGIINDILSDFHSTAKIDQCKLAIHQLQSELSDILIKQGDRKRAQEIHRYLDDHEIFSIQHSNHIMFVAPSAALTPSQQERGGTDVEAITTTNTPLIKEQEEVSDWV